MVYIHTAFFHLPLRERKKPPRLPLSETEAVRLRYLCRFKPSRNYLRGFLIAAWERVPKLESSPFQKHHFIFSLACGSFFVSPAYAGKSVVRELLLIVSRDHPRVCGEKTLCSRPFTSCAGSPPRMRGKAIPPRPYPCVSRITPAYAGKSSPSCCGSWRCRDHPRVCGEKSQLQNRP